MTELFWDSPSKQVDFYTEKEGCLFKDIIQPQNFSTLPKHPWNVRTLQLPTRKHWRGA